MEPYVAADTAYELAGIRYTRGEIQHRLLGKKGYGTELDRWLLNDNFIEVISAALTIDTPSDTRGMLGPSMLYALLYGREHGSPTPPRHQTVTRIFAEKSHRAGAVYLDPGHWIFVRIEVSAERLGIHFVDSLGLSHGDSMMRPRAQAFLRRYFSDHALFQRAEYSYTLGPRQVNGFDCGIICLETLWRFLADSPPGPPEHGAIAHTATTRVIFAQMLEKIGTIIYRARPEETEEDDDIQIIHNVKMVEKKEGESDDILAPVLPEVIPKICWHDTILELVLHCTKSRDRIMAEAANNGFADINNPVAFLEAMNRSKLWRIKFLGIPQPSTPEVTNTDISELTLQFDARNRRYRIFCEHDRTQNLLHVPEYYTIYNYGSYDKEWGNVPEKLPTK